MARGGAAAGGAAGGRRLCARRERCAALWGEGAPRRARGPRGADFKADKRKRDFEDAGANCAVSPVTIAYQCLRALRLAYAGARTGCAAPLLCGAASRNRPTKSASADRKTRQEEPSYAEPNVNRPEKTSRRPGNEPELTPSSKALLPLHDVKRVNRSLHALKK